MDRRSFVLCATASVLSTPAVADEWWKKVLGDVLSGDGGIGGTASGLSVGDVTLGLKDALRVSTSRVINRVGKPDGYLLDKLIHIPLPKSLQSAQKIMSAVGMSGMLDDLEVRLNRGAETAAPYAKNIFRDAIRSMTFDDAMGILKGPDDSATRYFQRKMTPNLQTTFRPIITNELDDAGAFTVLSNAANRYTSLPLGNNVDAFAKDKLVEHGLDYALDGIFHYLGKEEAAIRNNPAKRTTDILKKVFA